MSAFEDDVEPLEESRALGRGGGGTSSSSAAAGASSAVPSGGLTGALGKRMRTLSPEPDEEFDTTDGKHSMWLVKVPRFLLEGWSKVDEEDRRLGTVRVYDPDHLGNQRMELLLPPHPEPAIPLPPSHPYLQTNYPRKYDLRLTSEQGSVRVRNLYAFKERLEGGDEDDDDDVDDDDSDVESTKGKGRLEERKIKGRRVVSMVGTIANEAALKPQVVAPHPGASRTGSSSSSIGVGLTPEYREVLRKRRMEASKPRHSVKVLDESDLGRTNMLSSGVGRGFQKGPRATLVSGTGAASAQSVGQRNAKNTAERFARIPRNELLDILFDLFDEFPYWSIKGLRGKVQQPEAYLREVLSTVADLHKRGPYSGNWSLKPMFAEMRRQQQRGDAAAGAAVGDPDGSGTASQGGAGAQGSGSARAEANGAGSGGTNNIGDDNDDDDDDEGTADMDQVA